MKYFLISLLLVCTIGYSQSETYEMKTPENAAFILAPHFTHDCYIIKKFIPQDISFEDFFKEYSDHTMPVKLESSLAYLYDHSDSSIHINLATIPVPYTLGTSETDYIVHENDEFQFVLSLYGSLYSLPRVKQIVMYFDDKLVGESIFPNVGTSNGRSKFDYGCLETDLKNKRTYPHLFFWPYINQGESQFSGFFPNSYFAEEKLIITEFIEMYFSVRDEFITTQMGIGWEVSAVVEKTTLTLELNPELYKATQADILTMVEGLYRSVLATYGSMEINEVVFKCAEKVCSRVLIQ